MVPGEFNLPDFPEIWAVGNAERDGKPLSLRGAGMGFHTEGEDKTIPNAGSFLYAKIVPPEGGDTLYADMFAAYAALPDDIKAKIAGRCARFSRAEMHKINYPHMRPYTAEELAARPDVYHPLVRRHDRSGRVSLYVGRWACDIEGLPQDEGRALIAYLQEFARQDRFVYRHRWRDGDAVLWDNRCTQHCATPFDETRYTRLMHRTTLEDDGLRNRRPYPQIMTSSRRRPGSMVQPNEKRKVGPGLRRHDKTDREERCRNTPSAGPIFTKATSF
jgi:alpha-ketoglutarate-dependent taurine dioxygenase